MSLSFCIEWWEFLIYLFVYALIGDALGKWIWEGTKRWIRRILDAL